MQHSLVLNRTRYQNWESTMIRGVCGIDLWGNYNIAFVPSHVFPD
jgi:hypothetical protein